MEILKNKKFLLTILLTVLVYGGFIYFYRASGLSPETLQSFVNSFGVSGYLTLFLSQFIMSLTPVPDSILAVMGNVLYGPLIGSTIVYIAMLLAAIVHYVFAHRMGQKYVMKHIPEAAPYIQKLHGGNVFLKLVIIRVFSVVSFDISAYIAGVAGVKFKTFFYSTVVGLIPITINNILLSQGIAAKNWSQFIVIGAAYITFIALSWVFSQIFKKLKGF